ncbi:ubiquitin carboxyl-terminal hydrolase Usp2 isoform X2 [Sitodiplosis mosellana]|uniref:ubiquitin carboxyl-terminal hydrolase Usp2 isoform X2 n=1 Tax=Sitodiplosis mosellana TaxID=263140 RepID=UPI00244409E3|nr:ubiquitin carboxyl-terminal hydrolase Usp2 isoform X2 [Sitodiplosis mosellana]XP_055303801.1 ubiquitin carboxyl-terminal hydrolase Usp2 isoform X2 [Sitodiplosis mosellana]
MPAISTRFPTTRSTYLPSSTVESYRKSSYSSSGIGSGSSAFVDIPFRRSSLIGSYRSVNGDDTSTASGRSGVSTRYTSTSYTIPSTTSTSFTRKSIDRDFRSKPPIGSRVRSESRFRDLSLDNGYTTSSTIKPIIDSSPHSLTNSKRLSTSSLARTVATSGADLYDKYSVANYKPSCELSRSRSLTDSKLIDSLNANHHSSSRRSTSKDRISSGSLLAGSASDRDYLSNHRSTSPISASVKKLVSNGANNPLSNSIVVSSASLTNQNNASKLNRRTNISSIEIGTKCGAIKKSPPKVSTTGNGSGVCANDTKTNSVASVLTVNSKVNKTNNNQNQTMNGYKSMNGTIAIQNLNNNNERKAVLSSDSFKRRLGTNPLSPYRNPDFLKCEYDLARSQVVNSRSRSACGEKNNNNITSELSKTNGLTSTSLTSSPAKDSNRNKITIFGVNSASPSITTSSSNSTLVEVSSKCVKPTEPTDNNSNENMNANCVQQHTVDILDDIKFIDSDDSERRHSPGTVNVALLKEYFNDNMALSKSIKNTSTLPTTGASKKLNELFTNKYNTITNGNCAHQANGHFGNGIARKAVPEEMLSSTSSSTSTLSAMTESSTSSLLAKSSTAKENGTTIKLNQNLNHLDGGDSIRNSSVRAALPPTPNRDGKTTSSSISSRILPDTDAFTKSLAASSISDKTSDTDNTEGLCGLRNIGNTCFMNSIIQCLGHTKDLTRYLKTKIDIRSSTAAKDSRIVTEFSKLIKEMWTGATSSVTPSELKLAFSLKHRMYSGCSQQDAQEFLRFFLDALHCALNNGTKGEKLEIDESLSDNIKADRTWEWYSKVEKSVIKDLFVGQLKSSLKCTVCGNSSVTFDPFWDLSVSLPTSSRCKLESCLDLFIKEEVLDGDEMPTCSKCKTRRKSTKSFTIQRFPKYLVIHLKRFSETRWSKLTNIVEFPTGERELNMAPYAANSASVQYTLYGICNHMGSTAGGHYVAVCKHPTTRKWHEFNDNIVSPIYESGLISSSAYVLFYERVHEINQNNLVNASKHQTKQIFHNFLSKLPLSSSSHYWNVTNHFSNQNSTHATHSLNYELFNNPNASVSTSMQNQHDKQFAINFNNELLHRHFNQTAAISNQNYYHGFQYYGLTDSCARSTCKHRRASQLIDHISELIAHFMGNYHVISHVIIGIAFYVILFYFIYCIK